jgi:hypothetical protein
MKVSLNTIFGEILEDYPASEDVLRKYLGEAYCLTCPGKMFDTIGNGAMIHGLSDESAIGMVRDLQAVVDAAEGVRSSGSEEADATSATVPEPEHADHNHTDHDHGDHEHAESGHGHVHEDDDELVV